MELGSSPGSGNVHERSYVVLEVSHTIIRDSEVDEVQLVYSKLRFTKVDGRTILTEPMQNRFELTIVVSIVRCAHKDNILTSRRAITAIAHVADDLLKVGGS